MAIDSSIWIYQFQATMRDKEGRALVNAHVLGFLRRITKLLFYGIKPVFVFDGGAPALKRNTLNERKKKKSGAALSHAKIAERLLAAQMRREALTHAQYVSLGLLQFGELMKDIGARGPPKAKGRHEHLMISLSTRILCTLRTLTDLCLRLRRSQGPLHPRRVRERRTSTMTMTHTACLK